MPNVSGPLFDGRAQRAVEQFTDEAERDVADAGVEAVRTELGHLLRQPTGYYTSRITTERASGGMVVTDGGVVYGAWLAGVSERNQVSSFKGYEHWRLAHQRTEARVEQLVRPALRRLLDRAN